MINKYVFSADPKIAAFVRQNKGVLLTVLAIRADSVDAKANPTKAILGRVARHDLM